MLRELTAKDQHELSFWRREGAREMPEHRRTLLAYMEWFGVRAADSVLEVGIGPGGGIIPHLPARRKVALDPLISEYVKDCGLILLPGIEYATSRFEDWQTEETFDAIVSTNTIDHGELGFHIMPRFRSLLKPGGRLYLHVHLRPEELLNTGHDHSLTVEQLDEALIGSGLNELRREVLPADLDGWPCPTLMGVWEAA